MKKEVINFLNKCNLVFDNVEQLNGMEIPRDILLSKQKYEEIIEEIVSMKKSGFSSSSLTALQKKCKRTPKMALIKFSSSNFTGK